MVSAAPGLRSSWSSLEDVGAAPGPGHQATRRRLGQERSRAPGVGSGGAGNRLRPRSSITPLLLRSPLLLEGLAHYGEGGGQLGAARRNRVSRSLHSGVSGLRRAPAAALGGGGRRDVGNHNSMLPSQCRPGGHPRGVAAHAGPARQGVEVEESVQVGDAGAVGGSQQLLG